MSRDHRLCTICGTPLLLLAFTDAHYCVKCQAAQRGGLPVPLEAVSTALTALRDGTHRDAKRVRAKPLEQTVCACRGDGSRCDGALQQAHLFSVERHAQHPFVHHPHNRAALCRRHHRALHHSVDGFDFQGHAERSDFPPSDSHVLSLAYLTWVVSNIAPELRLKALRVGTLLENRTRHRDWSGDAPLEVSLFCRWFRGRTLTRIAHFKDRLYAYTENAYDRPGRHFEPGTCRTYRVKPCVVRALRRGPFLEPSETELRALLAWKLERSGVSRARIANEVRTTNNTKPSKATLSGWIARGQRLLDAARATPAALEQGIG